MIILRFILDRGLYFLVGMIYLVAKLDNQDGWATLFLFLLGAYAFSTLVVLLCRDQRLRYLSNYQINNYQDMEKESNERKENSEGIIQR